MEREPISREALRRLSIACLLGLDPAGANSPRNKKKITVEKATDMIETFRDSLRAGQEAAAPFQDVLKEPDTIPTRIDVLKRRRELRKRNRK